MIEETYEAIEAINEKDYDHIREELGDVYLMITMIAAMYEERGHVSIEHALHDVCEKLIRRHPHVYGNAVADDSDSVARQWEFIKQNVEGRRSNDSVLDKVSHALPPLERAYRMQKKAAKAGFDWNQAEPVWDKIAEELEETRQAWQARNARGEVDREHLEEELGDLLFSVVNVARYLKIDPAIALQRSNSKFDRRFRSVEKAMASEDTPMEPDSFERMNELWELAKREE